MEKKTSNNEEVALNIEVPDVVLSPNAALYAAREAFDSGKTRPISFRRTQLKNMLRMIQENKEEIYRAVHIDLKKPRAEAALSEIEVLRLEIEKLLRNLKSYSKRDYVPFNIGLPCDTAFVQQDALGVVLVLGAWNFPFMLTLQPVCGAIAAGNCVILKPSELAPESARVIAELVGKYLDKSCYHVIEADLEQTHELLKNKFDYIFATGSCNMGKAIMAAAAVHLTPTTLELGGKSPVYIHDSAQSNIRIAAKRILWGKLYNLGQVCVGPDYILCSKSIEEAFIREAKDVLQELYGDNAQKSPNLGRIINAKHFHRLKQLLDTTKGKLVLGGQTNEADRWISPTIFVDVSIDDPLMKDEIFGPILIFVTAEDPETALAIINARPKPLALYVFSAKKQIVTKFLDQTSSGGVCVNDVNLQHIRDNLPFGGVGDSGYGQYHGKYTFDTFSHQKSVLWRPLSTADEKCMVLGFRYSADTRLVKLMKYGMRYFFMLNIKLKCVFYLLTLALSMGLGGLIVFLLFYYDLIHV